MSYNTINETNSGIFHKQEKYVDIFNVLLNKVTEQDCIKLIIDEINSGRGGWCVTVNLEILRLIASDLKIHKLIEKSTIRVADGITLVWASRFQGTPLPERVCGSDLIYSLTAAISKSDKSIFLLGGNEGTAIRVANLLRKKYPGLDVAGTLCPPFGFEHDLSQRQNVINTILSSNPDIVFVALGFPKAEYLIAELRDLFPSIWWIGIGISFSYVCGDVKRPPKWARNLGFETLYRLIQEPRRLSKRYLFYGLRFAVVVLFDSWKKRFFGDFNIMKSQTENRADKKSI